MNENLKNKIEAIFGRRLNSSADYEALSRSIHQRVHILLSPTTLKRVFGYLKEDVKPRRTTLDVLSQYLGYKDYDDMMHASDQEQSNPILSESICCDELPVGQQILLTWSPSRECTVVHEGDGNFRVVDAKNTKLQPDDTFTCHVMIQHETLYLSEYVRPGLEPSAYVAGRVNGVTYHLL